MLEERIDNAVESYKNLPNDWDVFFMGFCNNSRNHDNIPKNYKNIMYKADRAKMGGPLLVLEGTNAYAVNGEKFLDILLERQLNPETCICSEFWPEFHLMEVFACVPQVFPQIDKIKYLYNKNIGSGIVDRYQKII